MNMNMNIGTYLFFVPIFGYNIIICGGRICTIYCFIAYLQL